MGALLAPTSRPSGCCGRVAGGGGRGTDATQLNLHSTAPRANTSVHQATMTSDSTQGTCRAKRGGGGHHGHSLLWCAAVPAMPTLPTAAYDLPADFRCELGHSCWAPAPPPPGPQHPPVTITLQYTTHRAIQAPTTSAQLQLFQ